MKKALLLLGFLLFFAPLFLSAQERGKDVQFVKYQKSVKGFEPSFEFDKKYIANEAISLNVTLAWNEQGLREAYIVFPSGTEIISATNMGGGFATLTQSIIGDTIKWKYAYEDGLSPAYAPMIGAIEIKLPANTSGNLDLDCGFLGSSETITSTVSLAQLGEAPKLVVSMNEWNAAITKINSTSSSNTNLFVYNDGIQDLEINSFTNLNAPFSYNGTLPLIIKSQQMAELSIQFSPEQSGIFENSITINSNGGNENIALSGAAYNDTFELIDFNDGAIQFPPTGWTIENYNNTKGWYSRNERARLDAHPEGGKNASAFISPAIDLSYSSNSFLGFNIDIYTANIAYIDIEYSTDNKTTWNTFASNITQGLNADGDYYKSLSSITAEQVYFKIKGTCEVGYLDIDNVILPNYYDNQLPPNPVNYIKPSHANSSVATVTQFQWKKNINIDGYKLYIGTQENLTNFYDVGDTSMYTADLESLTTYYWKVVPYNAYGDASDCPVWNFTTEEFIPTIWTDDTHLNTQITFGDGSKYLPKVNINSKGESFITWFSGEYGNLNVRAQVLNTDGSEKLRRGGVLISNNKQLSYISNYNNVIDNNDNLITGFVDVRNGLGEAFIYKMDAQGNMLWGENGISITNFDGRAYKTEIKKDTVGFIYTMTYIGTGADHNTMNYVFVKFDHEGNTVWSNDLVLTDEVTAWHVMPNGEIYISTFVDEAIYLNYYNTNMEAKFSTPVKVSNFPQFPPSGLKTVLLQPDKNKGMYVVWQAASMLGGIIKWQYVNADETIALNSGGEYMSTNQVRTRGYPRIAYHEKSDKLFVTWNEASPSTLNKGMYAQRMNNKGVLDFAATGKVIIECGDSIAGTDAFRIKGDTLLWFFSNYEPGTAWNNYLNVMFLDTDFNPIDELNVVRFSSTLSHKPLDAVDLSTDMAVMVWDENRNNQSSIFTQNLYYDGTLGYIAVDTLPPFAKKIEPFTNSELILTFNEELLKDSAEIISNYWFANSNAKIIGSTLTNKKQVSLLTEGLTEGNYKLYIKNATDTSLNTNLLDSIDFYFKPDLVAPEVILAKSVANNKIVIRFSEAILENNLSDIDNFHIEGIDILSIALINTKQIVLHTSNLEEANYTLTIDTYSDLMGNQVTNEELIINYSPNSGNEVYFYEDFENGIPTSFSLFNLDNANPVISEFNNAWIAADFSGGNMVAASTSYYDPADQANDWMITKKINIQKNAYLYWDAKALSAVYADGYEIWVSTTGNKPEDFQIKAFELHEENYELTNHFLNLADFGFGDELIYIAFRNNSNEKYILTIDNIAVYTPKLNDITVVDHSVPNSVMGASEIDLNVTIKALGTETIESVNFNWQLENGEVFTDNITNLDLAMGQSTKLNHTKKIIAPVSEGTYSLKIWTSMPNGLVDEDNQNDTVYATINVQQGYVQRLVTIEHFTNTSCGPCAQSNPILEELLSTNNNAEKVMHLSYHVWWPSDQDIFFVANPDDVVKRQQFYNVTAAPSVTIDGGDLMGPHNVTQEMINDAYNNPGLVNIDGKASYMTSSETMNLEIDLTNLTNFTDAQPSIFAVIAQNFDMSDEPANNGETYFPGVMRDVVSSNSGDLLTELDSLAVNSFTYEFNLPEDYIQEDAFIGIFIQDITTKDIYMASKTNMKETFKAEFNITYNAVAVQGASITINNHTYTSNELGQANINYLENNTYSYTITKDGYESINGSFEINNNDEIIDIELKPTGINSDNELLINIYPNPASDKISIESSEAIQHLSIVNISGIELIKYRGNNKKFNINISDLESGLYYIITESRHKKQSHKFIVK